MFAALMDIQTKKNTFPFCHQLSANFIITNHRIIDLNQVSERENNRKNFEMDVPGHVFLMLVTPMLKMLQEGSKDVARVQCSYTPTQISLTTD